MRAGDDTGGPAASVEWNLDSVRAAPSQSVTHLGLGRYVLIESDSTASGSPARAVGRAGSPGFERLVARIPAGDAFLDAIETAPEVKVARCSALGEPSSAYIRCDAKVLARDDLGVMERLWNRIKPSEHTVIELTPTKPAEPAATAPAPDAPDPPSSTPAPGQVA
jgi:hypothetical protein